MLAWPAKLLVKRPDRVTLAERDQALDSLS
jgi:hypothetical protein